MWFLHTVLCFLPGICEEAAFEKGPECDTCQKEAGSNSFKKEAAGH